MMRLSSSILSLCLLVSIVINNVNSNKISSIQLYAYYNAQMHNTRAYEVVKPDASSDLVLRRGANAYLAVRLAEPFNEQQSQLYLRVMFGPNPNQNDGSMFILPVEQGPGGNNGSWAAHSAQPKDSQVDFKLFIGSDAAVGGYRLNFVIVENNQIVSEINVPNSIYILFNPWSRADTVYMPDQTDIDEYVLNEFGVLYIGSVYDPEAKDWPYDQFKKSAIQTAVYLLDFLNLPIKQRADPVIVGRALSQMANSNDDNGVVFGKWTEPYKPDKAPWEWMSSGEVLDNYVSSGGNPVKYGQCWVFAAIVTTLSRTLGIPARTITTYAAAHDTDNSLTVDRFFEPNGKEVKGVNGDSVWNFHVWTEIFMARPDLPGRFRNPGWQVIDATPQEKSSDGIFKMGPANVQAAKTGDVNLQYDMPFLYSEVNADQISWVRDQQSGRWRKVNVITNSIGQLILTKKKTPIGTRDYYPVDETLNYKYREGTQEERQSIQNAGKNMNLPYVYDPSIALRKSKGDVNFEFKTQNKQTMGENMVVNYVLTNKASTPRTVDFKLNLKSTYYSGRDGEVLKQVADKIRLGPKESRNFTVTITPDEYLLKNVEFNQYKAIAFLRIEEKDVDFVDDAIIVLSKPKLRVASSNGGLSVRLKNPYRDQPLTNCKLMIKDGNKDKVEKIVNDIPAAGNFNYEYRASDKTRTVFMLDCKEMHDVRGSTIAPINISRNSS